MKEVFIQKRFKAAADKEQSMEDVVERLITTAHVCAWHRQTEKRITENFSDLLKGHLVTSAGYGRSFVVKRVIRLSVFDHKPSAYCETRRVKKDGLLSERIYLEHVRPNDRIEPWTGAQHA